MELSIVVPVYNMAAEGRLEYCLDSLLGQTIRDYEIIAVDDASTDNSLQILETYRKNFPDKLRVVASKENLRQGGARNLGIRAAAGEWLGMVDSDDWVAPDMYEKLLRRAKETGADVVGCDYSLVSGHSMEVGEVQRVNDDSQTGVLDEEKYRRLILAPGSMVVKIYRRDMIVRNGLWYPEHIFYEDNCMSPLWMLHAGHFERVPEPLYYYYQHDASTVHHVSVEKCLDRMKAMELLVEKSRAYGFYERFRPELEFKFAELYLVNTLFSFLQGAGAKRGRYGFCRRLAGGIREAFPDFRDNPYYREKIGEEERRLIALLMTSPALFLLCYDLLQCYRRLRR